MIRTAVVSPGLALRLGLSEILQGLPDVEVTAVTASAVGLPEVDVLVLTSAAMLGELDPSPPPVLLLSDNAEQANLLPNLPVWGMLPLETTSEELSAALHSLAEGLVVGAPGLMGRLFERHPVMEGAEEILDALTERERQVLQLAAEGLANKGIAAALQISEHTVKFHLSSLYAKLGVTSRTEAVRAGTRRGWVVL